MKKVLFGIIIGGFASFIFRKLKTLQPSNDIIEKEIVNVGNSLKNSDRFKEYKLPYKNFRQTGRRTRQRSIIIN